MFTYACARITGVGVSPEQSAAAQRDVRLINSCSAVMGAIAIVNLAGDALAGVWQFVVFDAAAFLLSLVPILLNHFSCFATARWVILILNQVAAFTTPALPGPSAHGEVIFASSLVLTMIVLHRHSRFVLSGMILFSIAGYAFLQLFAYSWIEPIPLTEAQMTYARVSLTLSSFALIIFLLQAALSLNRTLEEQIVAQGREINLARNQAEAALAVRSQFVSSMNHEIRTPLNGVIGLAHLLSRENLGLTANELVRLLRLSADTLFALINNALDLGKLEAGRVDLEMTPFCCKDLAENLEASLGVRAVQKGIEFATVVDPEIPRLVGDPVRLSQVLTNLAGNAIKFTEKGRVSVRMELAGSDENEARLSFRVRDTGIGMTAEEMAVIFQPYAQANSRIRSSYGGTGLGLAIARSILKLLDSELHVESAPGRGTEFSFALHFPIARLRAETQRTESIDLPGLRVLIAEDNDINLVVMERLLGAWGVRFVSARDGQEALNAAADQAFDLLLMDIQMPVLDGIEATRRLRETNVNLPVYGITADTSEAAVEAALSAGMNGVLPKPFRQEQLLSILEGIKMQIQNTREKK